MHLPLGMGKTTRAVQFSSYTFDISIGNIFTTLQFGGYVCVISEEERLNDLPGAMERRGVNFAFFTSTVTELLRPEGLPSLETLALIGEPVKPSVVEEWAAHVRINNGYGPAECSIHSTYNGSLKQRKDASDIGRILTGSVWVVNPADYHQLVPIGVVGELLIE